MTLQRFTQQTSGGRVVGSPLLGNPGRNRPFARRPVPRFAAVFVLVAGFLAWQLADRPTLQAQPNATTSSQRTAPVYLVEVPLPIAGTVDTQVKRQIDQLLSRDVPSTPRPILILEFSGAEQPGGTGSGQSSEFERCLSLARYLVGDRLSGTRTVAFVQGDLKGHALLPVIACEELIVDPDAEIGAAGAGESSIDQTMRRSYAEIAEVRPTIPPAVAVGMLDSEAQVVKVQTVEGVRYMLQAELAALKKSTTISAVESIVATGDMARFTGRELRLEHGFASHLATDRRELAGALRIPLASIQHDPTLDQERRALRVDIERPISGKDVNWMMAAIGKQIADNGVNFVCVHLNSPGGSAQDSLRLANYLASLADDDVRTVAYVRHEARADAALIALACDEMVVGRTAVLGGPGAVVIRKQDLPDLRRAIRALAESRHRDWSLPVALVDPSLVVHRYVGQGTNQVRYFSEEEKADQAIPGEWQQDAEIRAGGGLTGDEAFAVGLARQTAENFDAVRSLYGLDEELSVVQPNWATLLIERLASPHLAGTILFVGLLMFMIEMSQPGIGVAGFVSAICFVLFFWCNVLHGTAGWLEILLFVTGVGCLVLEIFVIPGFGIFGVGGSAMIVGSIVLASQTFVIPQNKYQIEQLPQSLMVLVAAGSGAFLSAFLLRKYLPDTPVLRHMLLAPPDDDEMDELEQREAVVHCEHLLGKRGKTTTRLNPAGKARFGDDVVDVIGEGELIGPGTEVHVVSVHGSRIVVVPVSTAAKANLV